MANKSLTEILKEMVAADRVSLPINPSIAVQITMCLANDRPDYDTLWPLVGRDPALLCMLFRTANSSFFAGLHKTASIDEAVTRLGSGKSVQIIERSCRESTSCAEHELLNHYMPRLWQHAQGCALGARWLASRCGYENLAEQACLAGLLHDIGKQFLLAVLQEISNSGEFAMNLSEPLIREVIATMHVEQGLRLFDEWNLPAIFRAVVASHHDEGLETIDIIGTLVKLANKGCHKLGLGLTTNPDITLPTTGEAQFLGITEVALAEFEIMLEDQFLGGETTPVNQ